MGKLVAVFLALLIVAVVCDQALGAGCTPGSRKFDGCNSCRCTSGGSWACTLKYCPPSRGGGGVIRV